MEKSGIVDQEVKKLIEKQVLEQAVSEDGAFLSNIFLLVPKKNGTHRLILNLKQFKSIDKEHDTNLKNKIKNKTQI